MKNTLPVIAALLLSHAGVMNSANKLYVVPADESGNVVEDSAGGYAGQQEMVQSPEDEHVYTLSGVEMTGSRFAVYGINEDNGMLTFYGTVEWAVSPLPVNYPSPLSIAPNGHTMELPEAGTYDFEFYDRDLDGITYHMLIPRPSAASAVIQYPSALYLVDASNDYAVLQGDMTTGIYAGDIEVPNDFRISYEPRYDMGVFIFGPSTDDSSEIDLHDGEKVSIAYTEGTSAVFTVSPTAKSSAENHVEVNLKEGYIVVNDLIGTSVGALVDSNAKGQYLTLSGQVLSGRPSARGIYIVCQDGVYTKVAF